MTARGNERRDIYRDEADRLKFLELVAAQSKLFRLRPRCYVLMDNHFHLGLETTEPNLSRAMEWQCELQRLVQATVPSCRTSVSGTLQGRAGGLGEMGTGAHALRVFRAKSRKRKDVTPFSPHIPARKDNDG